MLKNKKTKNKKFEIKKVAEKFIYSGIIIFILQAIINYLQTSNETILNITLKSFLLGTIMAAINFIKHKEKI